MPRRADGEGSIGKKADGTYYGAIRVDGTRKWVYGATRKEVVEKIKTLRQKAEQGIDLDADKLTVQQFLERWLEDVVKHRNKPRTHQSYTYIVNIHITPALGKIPLTALKPNKVQVLINELVARKLAARTIRYVRAVLRRALTQAMRWRYVSFNAAALVEVPRVEKYDIHPLTREEARQLLDTLKGHRLEPLYLMTLMLGLREGEVLGLLTPNLDFDQATIRIDGTLQYYSGKLVRESTKTEASVRTLPLPDTLIPMLKEHLERQQAKFPDNAYVFASVAGTPISPRNLLRQFKAILKKAKLRDIRFHDLRHSCATFLVARGVHPRTVMEILGHAQVSTTMNIYGHVMHETKVSAVSSIDKLLSEG
jgi:integrase